MTESEMMDQAATEAALADLAYDVVLTPAWRETRPNALSVGVVAMTGNFAIRFVSRPGYERRDGFEVAGTYLLARFLIATGRPGTFDDARALMTVGLKPDLATAVALQIAAWIIQQRDALDSH